MKNVQLDFTKIREDKQNAINAVLGPPHSGKAALELLIVNVSVYGLTIFFYFLSIFSKIQYRTSLQACRFLVNDHFHFKYTVLSMSYFFSRISAKIRFLIRVYR